MHYQWKIRTSCVIILQPIDQILSFCRRVSNSDLDFSILIEMPNFHAHIPVSLQLSSVQFWKRFHPSQMVRIDSKTGQRTHLRWVKLGPRLGKGSQILK